MSNLHNAPTGCLTVRIVTTMCACFLGLLFVLAAPACKNSTVNLPAAPLDDKPTLEKLASAYTAIAADLSAPPTQLRPQMRKKFVEQVFARAGFSYTATLLDLAKIGKANRSPLHNDMLDLVLLPHHGFKLAEVEDIYSESELKAVRSLD